MSYISWHCRGKWHFSTGTKKYMPERKTKKLTQKKYVPGSRTAAAAAAAAARREQEISARCLIPPYHTALGRTCSCAHVYLAA